MQTLYPYSLSEISCKVYDAPDSIDPRLRSKLIYLGITAKTLCSAGSYKLLAFQNWRWDLVWDSRHGALLARAYPWTSVFSKRGGCFRVGAAVILSAQEQL
jgi:hypothetical protein